MAVVREGRDNSLWGIPVRVNDFALRSGLLTGDLPSIVAEAGGSQP